MNPTTAALHEIEQGLRGSMRNLFARSSTREWWPMLMPTLTDQTGHLAVCGSDSRSGCGRFL